MNGARRKILMTAGCAAGAAAFGSALWSFSSAQAALPQGQFPEPGQSNPNATLPAPDPAMADAARKAMLKENQKDIKKNVEKLYDLASELKKQVEKTDSAAVLSLDLIRKAEEIEKLAKQIKDRAKG